MTDINGTGNDLAATLAIPEDPAEAVAVLRQNRVRTLDAARVRSEGLDDKFFVNVATGGMGAEVSGAADGEMKGRWGKLTYLRASLEVASEYDAQEVTLTLDGAERKLRAVNLAIGNCRYAGSGWLAAPRANPEDGSLTSWLSKTSEYGRYSSSPPRSWPTLTTWTKKGSSSPARRRSGWRRALGALSSPSTGRS